MAVKPHYVRWQDRVTGPFEIDELRQMAAQGLISRVHEVSTDQRQWTVAESLSGLFERPQPAAGQHVRSGEIGLLPDEPGLDDRPHGTDPVGAVSKGAKSPTVDSISDGSLDVLSEDDSISDGSLDILPDNDPSLGNPASPLPAPPLPGDLSKDADEGVTMDFLFGQAGPGAGDEMSQTGALTQSLGARDRSANYGPLAGIVAGILTLINVNLPHTRTDGTLQWWWSFDGPNNGLVLGLSALLLLVAAALCFSGVMLKREHRGLSYLGLFAIGTLTVSMLVVAAIPSGIAVFFHMLNGVGLTAIAALTLTHADWTASPEAGEAQQRAGLLGLIASLFTLGMSLIVMLNHLEGVTGGTIAVMILLGLGIAVSIAVSTYAMLAAKPDRVAKALKPILALVLFAFACLLVAGATLAIVAPDTVLVDVAAQRFTSLQLFRLMFGYLVLLGVFHAGLFDTMQCRLRPATGSMPFQGTSWS